MKTRLVWANVTGALMLFLLNSKVDRVNVKKSKSQIVEYGKAESVFVGRVFKFSEFFMFTVFVILLCVGTYFSFQMRCQL